MSKPSNHQTPNNDHSVNTNVAISLLDVSTHPLQHYVLLNEHTDNQITKFEHDRTLKTSKFNKVLPQHNQQTGIPILTIL